MLVLILDQPRSQGFSPSRRRRAGSAEHGNFNTQKIGCDKFLLAFLIGGDAVAVMTGTLRENALIADRSFNSFLNSSPLI